MRGLEHERRNAESKAEGLAIVFDVLGARTETETVDRALDYVVFTSKVFTALDALAALGGIEPVAHRKTGRARKVAKR